MISNAQACTIHVALKIAILEVMGLVFIQSYSMEMMGMISNHDYRFVLCNLSITSPEWTLGTTIINARTKKRVAKVS